MEVKAHCLSSLGAEKLHEDWGKSSLPAS